MMSLEEIRQRNLKANFELLSSFGFEEITNEMNVKRKKPKQLTSRSSMKPKSSKKKPRRSIRIKNNPLISLNEEDLMKRLEEEQEKNDEEGEKEYGRGTLSLSECLEDACETQSQDYLVNELFSNLDKPSRFVHYENIESSASFIQRLEDSLLSSQRSTASKVLDKFITCLEFNPTTNKAIVMAGSLSGQLGFWDITQCGEPPMKLQIHKYVKVTAIKAHKMTPSQVITAGTDGLVCATDIEDKVVREVHVSRGKRVYTTSMDFLNTHTILRGDTYNKVSVSDLRQEKTARSLELLCGWEKDKHVMIKAISVHPLKQQCLIAAAAGDGKVVLWDLRNSKYWLQILHQRRATTWCEFSNGGSRLLASASGEDIYIYDTDSILLSSQPYGIISQSNHKSPNISQQLRPRWIESREDCFVVGDLSQPGALIFNATNGERLLSLRYSEITERFPLWIYHQHLDILAGSTRSQVAHFSPPCDTTMQEAITMKFEASIAGTEQTSIKPEPDADDVTRKISHLSPSYNAAVHETRTLKFDVNTARNEQISIKSELATEDTSRTFSSDALCF